MKLTIKYRELRTINYRDPAHIKPKNIMVTPEGTVKVTDFGLAKAIGETTITVSGGFKGTAAYMAPELFRGESSSRASDIWSLGVLIYEVFEGNPPFYGETFESIGYQILNEECSALSPDVEETLHGLTALLDSFLAKDAIHRIQDGTAAYSALLQLAKDAGIAFVSPSVIRRSFHSVRLRLLIRRKTFQVALCGAVLLMGIILVTGQDLDYEQYAPPLNTAVSPSWNHVDKSLAVMMQSDRPSLVQLAEPYDSSILQYRINLPPHRLVINPSWAPNGRYLAIRGPAHLYVTDLNDEHQSNNWYQVGERDIESFSWSIDSRWIVCNGSLPEGNDSLFSFGPIDEISESLRLLSPQSIELNDPGLQGPDLTFHNPIYILEDKFILFVVYRHAENLGFRMVPASGGESTPLLDRDLLPAHPCWDPRHRAILFISLRDSTICRQQLRRDGRPRGQLQTLHLGQVLQIDDLDYLPDGERLVLSTTENAQDLWKIPIGAERDSIWMMVNSIHKDIRSPILSADGTYLLYSVTNPNSGSRLWQYDLNTEEERLLVTSPFLGNQWCPAPDLTGRYIAFCASPTIPSDSERVGLYVFDRIEETSTYIREETTGILTPVWAHDGQSLFYVTYTTSDVGFIFRIRRVPVNRRGRAIISFGNPSTLYEAPINHSLVNPLPGPSDSLLIFEGVGESGRNTIQVYSYSDSTITDLIWGDFPALSPDQRDLYFVREDALYRIHNWTTLLDDPALSPEFLGYLPPGFEPFQIRTIAISRAALYITLKYEGVSRIRIFVPN